ncbi:hypothetical protein [Hugenholtzia roseola]|uniref:hypothetical protein n=1 Tax=Hugenholtzia roseola TaxID=1002 RepID=UPI00047CF5E6|nr:hypothetical protein [Hugenholtzia roseola]
MLKKQFIYFLFFIFIISCINNDIIYKYEKDFFLLMNNEYKININDLNNHYVLILGNNSCNSCKEEVLLFYEKKLKLLLNNEKVLILINYSPAKSMISENIRLIEDQEGILQEYEINAYNPQILFLKNNKVIFHSYIEKNNFIIIEKFIQTNLSNH